MAYEDLKKIINNAEKCRISMLNMKEGDDFLKELNMYNGFFRQIIQMMNRLQPLDASAREILEDFHKKHEELLDRLAVEQAVLKKHISGSNAKLNVNNKYFKWAKRPGKIDEKT